MPDVFPAYLSHTRRNVFMNSRTICENILDILVFSAATYTAMQVFSLLCYMLNQF